MGSGHERAPLAIERSLVRLASSLSAVAALLYLATAAYTGDSLLLAGVTGPAAIAVLGLFLLRTNRARVLPLMLAATAVTITQNAMLGIHDIADASLVPLALIGITGAFFVQDRFAIPYVVGFSAIIFVSRLQWSSEATRYLQAGIVAASVAFGTTLLAWVRREFSLREDRYRTLFEHAPVSLWREDYSLVGAEIAALADRGITNLEAHLTENPEEVRRLASLVRVIDANDAAATLTEAPDRNLLIGPLPMDTFSRGALESFIPQFVAIADNSEKATTELKGGLTMTGRPIEALLVWSAPRVAGELDLSNVTVAIVDITRQREAERRLQDLVDSKDQFVATISHELRTPLTAVVGIAEELRNADGSIDEAERSELLDLVAEQSHEVTRIVDDLLVVARTDAGNLMIEAQPVDLAAETATAVQAIDSGIAIETLGTPTVFADPQRVRQIIRNLVTNAQRYGGPDIRVAIRDEGNRGVVEVRDDGEPLPPASRTEIFEPYARAKQRAGVTASVGLGLTVSRRLARHMGGDLVYDHDGSDAMFTLTLTSAHRPAFVSHNTAGVTAQSPAGR
ncbi:MAG: HAMP domain-containing sensor histidine kinase [Actinomycetota bacterium]